MYYLNKLFNKQLIVCINKKYNIKNLPIQDYIFYKHKIIIIGFNHCKYSSVNS